MRTNSNRPLSKKTQQIPNPSLNRSTHFLEKYNQPEKERLDVLNKLIAAESRNDYIGDRNRVILCFIIGLGATPTELALLKWYDLLKDIDPGSASRPYPYRDNISIPQSRRGIRKSEATSRRIHLPFECVVHLDYLQSHGCQRNEHVFLTGRVNSQTAKRRELSAKSIKNQFHKIMGHAGISGVNIQSNRRKFINCVIMRNSSIETISSKTGLRSNKDIARRKNILSKSNRSKYNPKRKEKNFSLKRHFL